METASVKINHLHFNGKNYFRGSSTTVRIGSYGEKRDPINQANYLDVKGNIPWEKIGKVDAKVVKINNETDLDLQFDGDISAVTSTGAIVGLSGGMKINQLKKQKLELILMSISPNRMMRIVNKANYALGKLKDYGKDARIVLEAFIVVEAELASEMEVSGSLGLSGKEGEMKATLKGEGSIKTRKEVTFPKDACFAYMLHKIDWDMKFLKKEKIKDLDDDQWGSN